MVLIARLSIVAALGLTLQPGCSKQGAATAGLPGCSADGLTKTLAALTQVEPESRGPLAAAGIAESCGAGPGMQMPAGLRKALEDAGRISPEMRAMSAMRAVTEVPALWSSACAGGLAALQSLAAVAPEARAELMADQCKLHDKGYASAAEIGAAALEDTILAALTYEWMAASGGDKAMNRKLARALLGLQ